MKKTKGYPAKTVILILCGLLFLALSFTARGSSEETAPILIPLKNIPDLVKCKAFPYYGAAVVELAFSPDGKSLALGLGKDKGSIYLWNVESGKISALTSSNYTAPPRFCFSPDGKILAAIIDLEHLVLFDVVTGSSRALDHVKLPRFLRGVAFSPDGNTVASVGDFKGIDLWDVKSGRKTKTLQHKFDGLLAVKFSPDGNALAAVIKASNKDEDNGIGLFDLKTGKMVALLSDGGEAVWSFAFSPDGRILVSGGTGKSIIIRDAATGGKLKHIQGLDEYVYDLAFSPDGKTLAAALGSAVVFLDLETDERLAIKDQNQVYYAAAFSPDGRFLATGGYKKEKGMELTEGASLWETSFLGVKSKFKKDEFETTKEYEARMSRVEVPYSTTITLRKEQYNADRGGFAIDFMGNRLFIPVERDKAKELVGRKAGEIELAGKLKYFDPENLVLVEGWIVDAVTREKYAVGKDKK